MEFSLLHLLLFTFWLTFLASAVIIPMVIDFLNKHGVYRKLDRKKTLYNTEATEFNAIREREDDTIKKANVPRIGGLSLIAVFTPAALVSSLVFDLRLLLIATLCIIVATLIALMDDLIDVGKINRTVFSILKRFILLGGAMLVCGWSFWLLLPNTLTFLPIPIFENVYVGIGIIILFPAWVLFWQASSVIDGIDGLAGNIYLVLFMALSIISFIFGNIITLILSLILVAILIPWLYFNIFPAQSYLTETGITFLTVTYAVITFLLALGSGESVGIWIGLIFGGVLIATFVSNLIQLHHRRKYGRKLFRVAPVHHHLEAIGINGSAVVNYYLLTTILFVILGISVVLVV